jgi:multidrug efflux system membrane fusion protein
MKKRIFWIILLLAAAATAIYFYLGKPDDSQVQQGGHRGKDSAGRPMPVRVAAARSGDIDVTIDALGTVIAHNAATVKARVDGQLQIVSFREGQLVKAGDLLATIDARPFQVQLDQANGQLLRDQALLANAQLDAERYRGLLVKDSIAKQQVDAQEALVLQDEGVVKTDRAQVDNARLQLGFTQITAPLSGRLGLRQIDAGNQVHAIDANGIVLITQTQPINVIFSIPADQISAVLAHMQDGKPLAVEAFDHDGKSRLASGKLQTLDNQIDATTGTVKLKAEFANADNVLFPNQFVNARLCIDTRHGVTLVPTAAIQRGTQGSFVYVIDQAQTVSVRSVTLGPVSGELIAVEKGIAPGEQVVIDGADKLREGAKVEVPAAGKDGQSGAAGKDKESASAHRGRKQAPKP